MAGFDAQAYKKDVLKPNSRGEGLEQLREVLQALGRDPASKAYGRLDLNTIYAVPSPVTASELQAWKKSIISTLNKAQMFHAAPLLKSLLDHFEQQGNDVTDPAFWGAQQAARQQHIISALERGVEQLKHEYPLGVVTVEELTARLGAIGVSGVTEASIVQVATGKSFSIYPEFELPSGEMPSASLKNSWKDLIDKSAYRSILDVLLLHAPDRAAQATFINRLTAAGAPLSLDDVHAAHEKADKSKDTNDIQFAKKFLGAVKLDIPDEASLRELVLIAFTQLVSARIGRGQPLVAVRDHLISIGIAETDSSRLVAAVDAASAGSSGGGPRITLDQARELLSKGLLAEAERTHAAVPDEGDEAEAYKRLGEQIAKLRTQKSQAIERYRLAMQSRDFHAAGLAIGEAISIDAADESLVSLRAAVPPFAPRSLQLRMDGESVVLSWAQGADAELNYTVVRAEGRLPASISDGVMLADAVTETNYRDAQPPSAVRAGYAVFASRDGRVFSDPATAEITVLQTPSALHAESDLSSTQLSWSLPSSAAGAVISRLNPDGSSIETEVLRGSTLHIPDLSTGARYRVSARAIYLFDSGRELSEAVSIEVVPRGSASPVRDLHIEAEASDGRETLRASWSEVDGFEVELWTFPRNADIGEGTTADAARLQALQGKRMTVHAGAARNGKTAAALPDLTEIVKIVPMTVTDDGHLAGIAVVTGSAPSASNIIAERFGDELRISWDWPNGDYLMELSWLDNGRSRTRRITRTRYRTEGGAVLSNAATVSQLRIATVVRVDDDDWMATPVPVQIAAHATTKKARYRMQIKKALIGGKVNCQIVVESDTIGFTAPAEVVLKRGSIMPYSPEDGEVVERIVLDFSAGKTSSHFVAVGKAKSPFWMCLFTDDDVELTPPHTSEMKG